METRIATITREDLLSLWRERCPTVTDAELAESFDVWWNCGALDVRLKDGKPVLVLTGKQRRQ